MTFENKSFVHAFVQSLTIIWITEIGDKTFFIAALLAMQYPSVIVFLGAFGALFIMTVLSALFGNLVPHLISTNLTNFSAIILFLFFGIKMLNEAYLFYTEENNSLKEKNNNDDSVNKINESSLSSSNEAMMEALESIEKAKQKIETNNSFLFLFLHPVFIQSFILTFLAEWGDRSQIATITLATTNHFLGVTLGAIVGHFMCTGIAVIGGRIIGTKISIGIMNGIGGILFFLFAFVIFYHEEIAVINNNNNQ